MGRGSRDGVPGPSRAGAWTSQRGLLLSWTKPSPHLAVVEVRDAEQPPAFGAFAFAKDNLGLREAVDAALGPYLGSAEHRSMMARYGFNPAETDRTMQ